MNRKKIIGLGATLLVVILSAVVLTVVGIERRNSRRRACFGELILIEAAKEQYADKYGKAKGAIVTLDTLREFTNIEPNCPSGGKYEVNPIGVAPKCSIHGEE